MSDYNGHGIIPGLLNEVQRGEQPLSEEKRAFVRSIYALLEQFKTLNLEYLNEIQLSRSMRKLADPYFGPNDIQLNTLNSTMDNMVADYVDNMPEIVLMPETIGAEETARQMTDVLGWVMHHAHFSSVWKAAMEDAVVTGTGVIQGYYDDSLTVGGVEGNIGLLNWPPESWLPDPLYDNFQDGRAVFKVCNHPMSYFLQHYPDEAQYISPDGQSVLDYMIDGNKYNAQDYDDPLVCLLEVWYRRYDAEKKRYAIHMAKVAGNVLLEDSRDELPGGVYAHGRYPFVSLRFRKRKSTAYGSGMCHDYADTQRSINRSMKYIDENIRQSSRLKMLVSETAGIDMLALTDYNKEVVMAKNRITRGESYDWMQPNPLNSLAPNMMGILQDQMKQDSGQNQFTRGEGGLGVTAASAINLLQNAGGKISRLHINEFINDFRCMCEQIISLIGEFFKEKRIFTIYGEQGGMDMRQVEYDREAVFGGMDAYRNPAFMIRIMPQRTSPDQVEVLNQKILRMVELSGNAGSPIPPVAVAKMLQMTGKEQIIPILEETDAQQQLLVQLQQQLEMAAQQLQAASMENAQLQQGMEAALNEAQKQQQMMAAVGQQMSSMEPFAKNTGA